MYQSSEWTRGGGLKLYCPPPWYVLQDHLRMQSMHSYIGTLVAPIISLNNGLFWVWLLDYFSKGNQGKESTTSQQSVQPSEQVTHSLHTNKAYDRPPLSHDSYMEILEKSTTSSYATPGTLYQELNK